MNRWLHLWLRLTCFVIGLVALPSAAEAAITFTMTTGNNTTGAQSMLVDSNNCPAKGPRAMYVGGTITNTGATAVTNIVATLGSFSTTNVSLTGGQPASQTVGALGAGETIGIYWLTTYVCTDLAVATTTVSITSSTATASKLLTLTVRKAISANAGGNLTAVTVGAGAVVGQTLSFDASYSFGGTANGDEFFFQPNGSETFRADCFRLVGSQIISSALTDVSVGTTNVFYFVNTAKQTGTGYVVQVRYFFEYQCAGTSTVARPYAVQTSGSTNVKYTGNYDATLGVSGASFPGATNPFTITKTASTSFAVAGSSGTLDYTVTISNPSAFAVKVSKIVDTLPTGFSFSAIAAGSGVTAANSSSIPASGATGTITFLGKLGQTYSLAANGSLVLKYTVNRSSTAGTYTNAAVGYFGSATTPTATASVVVGTVQPLAVSKTSAVLKDPVVNTGNGTTTFPHAIPGSTVTYTISISNPNSFAIDTGTIQVNDKTPTQMKMCLRGGVMSPVTFVDDPTVSGLSFTYGGLTSTTDNLEFSNDNGATWAYVPTLDADGCDAAITNFRIVPTGSLAANKSFSANADYQVK